MKHFLLSTERKDFLAIAQKAGLVPAEFKWQVEPVHGTVPGGDDWGCSTLLHSPSGYFFQAYGPLDRCSDVYTTWSPAQAAQLGEAELEFDDSSNDIDDSSNQIRELVASWVTYLARELASA